MSSSPVDHAKRLAEARLARPVQDELEASVVLEAWVGEVAPHSLDLGQKIARHESAAVTDMRPPARERAAVESLVNGLGLVLAVVLVATWSAPVAAALGADAWNKALVGALPATLALEWIFLARHQKATVRPSLAGREVALELGVLVGAAGALALAPQIGWLAGLLVVTWVCGAVLVELGWTVAYLVLLAVSSVALHSGLDPAIVTGTAALAAISAVMVAARPRTEPTKLSAGLMLITTWGAVGAGFGLLLVADHSIGWGFAGTAPALALIPSAVGSLWGSRYLSRIHWAVPDALDGVDFRASDRFDPRGVTFRIMGGAALRMLGATLALSVVCVIAGRWTEGTISTSLFAAFAAFGAASMFVTLLVSIRRMPLALTIIYVSLLLEFVLRSLIDNPAPGTLLLIASTFAALCAATRVAWLFSRPGRALATGLWL